MAHYVVWEQVHEGRNRRAVCNSARGAELALEHLLRANRRGPQVEYHLTFLE